MQEKYELQGNESYSATTTYKNREVLQPRDVKLSKQINSKHIKLLYVVVAVLTVIVIGACTCIVAAYVEIWKLRSEVMPSLNMANNRISHMERNISNRFTALDMIANTLAEKVTNHSTAIAQISDDVTLFHPRFINSCATISQPSPSGYYWVNTSAGSSVRVYCDMTRSCGGITGGWMRVADLDMRNSSARCPRGLTETLHSDSIRTCIQTSTGATCSSDIDYATLGISYSHVCGMIRGYGIESLDGFRSISNARSSRASADTNYVDGVSLTHGVNHGQHIWTFAGDSCPCSSNRPVFIGNDFSCDNNDVLWDGSGCEVWNIPWFYRHLPERTADDIQMRVCRDEARSNEDIRIEKIEFFVQ